MRKEQDQTNSQTPELDRKDPHHKQATNVDTNFTQEHDQRHKRHATKTSASNHTAKQAVTATTNAGRKRKKDKTKATKREAAEAAATPAMQGVKSSKWTVNRNQDKRVIPDAAKTFTICSTNNTAGSVDSSWLDPAPMGTVHCAWEMFTTPEDSPTEKEAGHTSPNPMSKSESYQIPAAVRTALAAKQAAANAAGAAHRADILASACEECQAQHSPLEAQAWESAKDAANQAATVASNMAVTATQAHTTATLEAAKAAQRVIKETAEKEKKVVRQTARDADRAAKTLIHDAERAARRAEKDNMGAAAKAVKVKAKEKAEAAKRNVKRDIRDHPYDETEVQPDNDGPSNRMSMAAYCGSDGCSEAARESRESERADEIRAEMLRTGTITSRERYEVKVLG